jgi:hypothetical protein
MGVRRRWSGHWLAPLTLVGLVLLGLIGGPVTSASAGPRQPTTSTVWLCQPGAADDPCTSDLASTAVTASGATSVTKTNPSVASKYDCFYVYPTVSTESGANADLTIQPAETAVAVQQAARFSQVCRVWAPMYRQRTVASLFKNQAGANQVAYASLLAGWKDYLAHDNHGRPIIFIGHSQGAAILIRLLESQIDPNPRLRARMVSAILLGGNVTVPVGRDVGGSFDHIPTCRAATETGCVIAYSSFGTAPPADSLFGRPGTGVSALSNQTATAGLQVACVNPATFSNTAGALLPYFLSATAPVPGVHVGTPWVSFPGLYTARCATIGGATTLQVTPTAVPADPRPLVKASLGPLWGFHLVDVNLSLGNLVADVAREEASYRG